MKLIYFLIISICFSSCAAFVNQIDTVNATTSYSDSSGQTFSETIGVKIRHPNGLSKDDNGYKK